MYKLCSAGSEGLKPPLLGVSHSKTSRFITSLCANVRFANVIEASGAVCYPVAQTGVARLLMMVDIGSGPHCSETPATLLLAFVLFRIM